MATDAERDAEYKLVAKQEADGYPESEQPQVQEHRIHRPNHVDLLFTGTLLSEVSSEFDAPPRGETTRMRWQTVRLFRSVTGRYIIEEIGHSKFPHEKPFVKVCDLDTPADVRKFFVRVNKHQQSYLTDLAVQILEEAAENDPDMVSALTESV